MDEFKDKVVLITDAGKGFGQAIAYAFADHNAIVAANDLTPINLDQTVARIRAAGGKAQGYIFDIAKKMPVTAMINQVLEDWGRIDVLINNASVDPRASILTIDEWDWRRTIDVNLTGTFFTLQAVGKIMSIQGGGVILNVAYEINKVLSLPNHSAYYASKTGLLGLTRVAAREFTEFNIRVNVLYPDYIDLAVMKSKTDSSLQSIEGNAQLRQHGSMSIIDWVLYLCSDQAAHITGEEILIDSNGL